MSRIAKAFARRLGLGGKSFVPFLPLGFPSLAASASLIVDLDRAGADILELGLPFSDSLADGPTIQHAYHQALAAGVTVGAALDLVAEVRPKLEAPIVLMCCYNLIHKMGILPFAARARQAGIDGVIAPDLPLEESEPLRRELDHSGIDLIGLVSPTTPLSRAVRISRASSGFVYYISRKGVTGVGGEVSDEVAQAITALRSRTSRPVVVGFGISSPAQAAVVARGADGVIVGSALVDLLSAHPAGEGGRLLVELAHEFRRALGGAQASR